jgi:hypothetical protein
MKLTKLIEVLSLVSPLYGVDTAKIELVIKILKLLMEDETEEKK